MPDRPFGSESLAVPVYLVKGTGADDPGLAAWKQEHPNWMVAGNWTPTPRPTPAMPPTPDQGRAILRPVPNASFSSLDPATISVADFRRITDRPDKPTGPTNPQTTGAHVFHLPDGRPIPDHTQAEKSQGLRPLTPTSSTMISYPANVPEIMAADREDERSSTRDKQLLDFRQPKPSLSENQ